MSGSGPIHDEQAPVTTDWRWAQIPEELLYDPTISPQAVRVYGCLVRHGTTPDSCYPTHARIAEKLGLAKRSVARPLAELEQAGWINRTRRFNARGDRVADGYHVLMASNPSAQLSAPTTRSSAAPSRDPARHQDAESRGQEGEPLNESHERTSSSTGPHTRSADAAQEEEAATPDQEHPIDGAGRLFAERALSQAGRSVGQPTKWKRSTATNWVTEHRARCWEILVDHPDSTAERLLAKIEGSDRPERKLFVPPPEMTAEQKAASKVAAAAVKAKLQNRRTA